MFVQLPDDQAARQFEIEALRQITDNLRRLNAHAEKTNDALERTNQGLHAIDIRLTRIESNSVNVDVKELQDKVDLLERAEDRRDGAMSLTNWALRNWPSLIGLLTIAFLVLQANGKL